jgi:diketogulonate reductase-like aldo/keto reductase
MIYVSASGDQVPALGLGTWQLQGNACREVVREALAMGYRHIDTAQGYDNETEVGAGIRMSGVDRSEIFVVSKLWRDVLKPDDVRRSTRESLKRLNLEVLDMLLIHWPSADVPLEDTLGAMADLQREGMIRHLGVSNFTPALLDEALWLAPISCLQAECHPFFQQADLRSIARDAGMMFTAYCPLARGDVFHDPVLQAMGRRHDKSAGQVALRWLIQHPQVAAIPRASSLAHLAENLDIFDFSLTNAECREIFSLDRNERLIDPPWAPNWRSSPRSEIRREANKAIERPIRSQPSSARHPHE